MSEPTRITEYQGAWVDEDGYWEGGAWQEAEYHAREDLARAAADPMEGAVALVLRRRTVIYEPPVKIVEWKAPELGEAPAMGVRFLAPLGDDLVEWVARSADVPHVSPSGEVGVWASLVSGPEDTEALWAVPLDEIKAIEVQP